MSHNGFYKAFEDRHRGSRELIKSRVKIYLQFIQKLQELYPNTPALDIGCGRGEWLELLKDNGISAQGIDIDSGMLKPCYDLGLNVIQGNGVQFLKEQKDNSRILISAFHVVEHISFDELQLLVGESLRVLKPGGILLLETPNPENIKVATESFYLDPTHIKPIPSGLLSFLPEFHGYTRTKVLRLQETKDLVDLNSVSLMQVLEGVSPDYAVVAQKEACNDVLEHFDSVFNKEFGISLCTLTDKFEHRILNIEAKASEAEIKVIEFEARVIEFEARAIEFEAKANQAEANLNESNKKLSLIMASKTWRVFGPYRYFRRVLNTLISDLPLAEKKQRVKTSLVYRVQQSPKAIKLIKFLFSKFPFLKVIYYRKFRQQSTSMNIKMDVHSAVPLNLREQRIYNDIKLKCSEDDF